MGKSPWVRCSECRGSGYKGKGKCIQCGGRGGAYLLLPADLPKPKSDSKKDPKKDPKKK